MLFLILYLAKHSNNQRSKFIWSTLERTLPRHVELHVLSSWPS